MSSPPPPTLPLFHIVLCEPEIPNNTGNIGRTCVATGCALHLVHPLGFDTSEKACRRAGLDYWPRLAPREHESFPALLHALAAPRLWLFSTKATRTFWDADLAPGDALVFGKETAGLPSALLAAHADRTLTLPMLQGERSLNLATVVCTVIYEGLRQLREKGLVSVDNHGRLRAQPHAAR
ncbi:MAG: tRNA (cytidine(34)-2'-O)-methyltransferase [Phycisphaerales bacterium]